MTKRARVIRQCEVCSLHYLPPNNMTYAARGKRRFCSNTCRATWRSIDPGVQQHMARISKLGIAAITPEDRSRGVMLGPKNPAWKGGVTLMDKHGSYGKIRYVRCPASFLPMARKDGYVMEHRLVIASIMRRPLQRVEVVHHRDHNPRNNDPANLELWPDNSSHKRAEHGQFVEGAANRVSSTD